jgi:hypothetical protein
VVNCADRFMRLTANHPCDMRWEVYLIPCASATGQLIGNKTRFRPRAQLARSFLHAASTAHHSADIVAEVTVFFTRIHDRFEWVAFPACERIPKGPSRFLFG